MRLPTESTRNKGAAAENAALHFLEKQGYQLNCRNFRIKEGEIDLIMVHPEEDCLVFIEVKSGNMAFFPGYLEGINRRKCAKIAKVASVFIENLDREYAAYRIDAVFVERGTKQEFHHLKNVYCMA